MYTFTSKFSEKIFNQRYTFFEGETWPEACKRVADHIARPEKDFKRWSESFYRYLSDGLFCPGGRIWYGSGRTIGQLLNCFVIPCEDSREGWGDAVRSNIIIAGEGGGVGESYRKIRYRGAPIHGIGGEATGAVSIMRIENGALQEIKSGGGRRAARMGTLPINHPDIEEFLASKLDHNELNNFNISVWFDEDPEGFFQSVRDGKDLELVWQNQVIRTVPAATLWNKIVENALKNGEPGILNGHLMNKMNSLHYCGRQLVATNPCGEIPLQPYGVCCLGSIVLPRIVKKNSVAKDLNARINWGLLHKAVYTAVRFLDNVLDMTHYPLPQIKEESMNTRRIGVGVMGVHHFLLLLGLKYSSSEGLEMVDKISSFIKHTAFDASIALAIEKGVFPLYDTEGIQESGFIQTLKPSIRSKIEEHGLRNCNLLDIAPTGTTSIIMNTSSGIEPIFAPATERTFWEGENRASEIVLDPLYEEFLLSGKDTSHFESADEITVEAHLNMLLTCQKHIDQAVSKTINLPQKDYNVASLSELYMKYVPQVKGMTIYPEGSREFTPLRRLSLEEAYAYLKTGDVTTEVQMKDCASGQCEI